MVDFFWINVKWIELRSVLGSGWLCSLVNFGLGLNRLRWFGVLVGRMKIYVFVCFVKWLGLMECGFVCEFLKLYLIGREDVVVRLLEVSNDLSVILFNLEVELVKNDCWDCFYEGFFYFFCEIIYLFFYLMIINLLRFMIVWVVNN